jgi:hypothetical protein
MPLDFPNSPSVGARYTSGGTTWQWDGTKWLAVSTTSAFGLMALGNYSLAASVASNILTVALKDSAGNDPTTSTPINIPYRNATLASGPLAIVPQTAALSIATIVGATFGTVASTPFRLWVVVFNNAGVNALGLINCSDQATLIYPLQESGVASGVGMSSSSTAIGTIYSPAGVTISNQPFRVLGFLEWASGLATAGSFATARTLNQVFVHGLPTPGRPVGKVRALMAGVAGGFSTASGAGWTAVTNGLVTITPLSVCNAIKAQCAHYAVAPSVSGVNSTISTRMYRGAGAIGSTKSLSASTGAGGTGLTVPVAHLVLDFPRSTAAQTYQLYIAPGGTYIATVADVEIVAEELMG